MYTTVADIMKALSVFPTDTPVFGINKETLQKGWAIQAVAGLDGQVSQILLHSVPPEENWFGLIERTGTILKPSLCDL
jgi:hypothetical protein